MKRIMTHKGLWMIATMMVCTSCLPKIESQLDQSEKESEGSSEVLKPASAYFDFNLTKSVTLSLDYGTWGGSNFFGIYTENPVTEDDSESDTRTFRSDIQTVATVFTDKEGKYTGSIEVPSCVETLYVVTTSPWLVDVLEAKIENGRATVKSGNYTWTNTKAATRLASEPIVKITTGNYSNLYSIVGNTWDQYGKSGDPNGIIGQGSMTTENMQQIYRTLLNLNDTETLGDFATYVMNNSARMMKVDNSSLLCETDVVNCSIATTFVDENGETRNVENAKIGLTFISEGAAYMSTLGYYYYKTGELPASANDVKKYMVFPNASAPSGTPFAIKNWRYSEAFGAENAPIGPNTRVQLLYEDEAGNVSTDFPPGYTIGFFLIANSMGGNGGGEKIAGANTLKSKRNIIYSNVEWNTAVNKAGNYKRYIVMEATDGRLVYGLEDAPDNLNCCDLLFYVDCNPSAAIEDPRRPKVNPVTPVYYIDNTVTKNYAFEDQWPTGGDYDLNDVIIQHDRVVSKTTDNYVVKIVDRFTPIQPAGAANFRNAFAVRGSAAVFAAVTNMTDGVLAESETNSYLVTTNTNGSRGKTISLVREFPTPVTERDAAAADWEPYIIAQYAPEEADRIEIHLPKQSATALMREGLVGTADDAYFIDKTNMYPFAINIPSNFEPAPESTRIDAAYPKYVDWVTSSGSSNSDWYKYPNFE